MGEMKTVAGSAPAGEITAAAMQALEAAAFASGRLSQRDAMARAGEAVAAAIRAARPCPGRALVLAGPGNNGGDGFVVAQALRSAGWTVSVAALAPERLTGAAAEMRDLWLRHGAVAPLGGALPAGPWDAVVDALFGIGLARPLDGVVLETVAALAALRPPVLRVAVDLPSGLDADTGDVLGACAPADLTVTFHAAKPAHRLRPELCGRVIIADIGL